MQLPHPRVFDPNLSTWLETEEPRPQADEVLVDVHAAAVSYTDYLMAYGGYQMRPALPYIWEPTPLVSSSPAAIRSRASAAVSVNDHASSGLCVDFIVGSTVMQSDLTALYALIERARLQVAKRSS